MDIFFFGQGYDEFEDAVENGELLVFLKLNWATP